MATLNPTGSASQRLQAWNLSPTLISLKNRDCLTSAVGVGLREDEDGKPLYRSLTEHFNGQAA
jgi:hypothetical protein